MVMFDGIVFPYPLSFRNVQIFGYRALGYRRAKAKDS